MTAEPAPKETPNPEGGSSIGLRLMPHMVRHYALRLGWALEGLTPVRRAEILESLPEDAFLRLLEEAGVADEPF